MHKKKRASSRKGPAAMVAAVFLAVVAAVFGIHPGALRNAPVDGPNDVVEMAGQHSDSVPTTGPSKDSQNGWASFLTPEARSTVTLIQRGGPYPYRQDGTIFQNREKHLPQKQRGWYREYTVDTPGLSHRGPRRIVTGGHPPTEWYYTADHYETFQSFTPPARTH